MALGKQRLHRVGIAPDNQGLHPAHHRLVHHLELLRQGQLRDQLHLDHIVLKRRQGSLQKHLSLVHDAHVVADVLQLPEVVGGNQNGGAVLCHIVQNHAHDLPAHHRIQAVHRLVEDEHLRAAGDGQPEGRLLLHALGKAADGLALVEGEDLPQPVKPPFVEAWVGRSIELFEISDAVAPLEEDLVGDIDHDPFLFRVFIDGLLVQGDRPGVGAVDSHQAANQRGLARAVGSHQAIDRAPGHGEAQVRKRREAVKGFGEVFHFKHSCPPVPVRRAWLQAPPWACPAAEAPGRLPETPAPWRCAARRPPPGAPPQRSPCR